ncbi:Ammonium transporter [hydrothermal vent metagenome]|uniref:Ammonium transporter n=1 Tax=hydrothermal vent metagenome TaxID=652676 RepID=A0A3B0SIS3_9ZZZZ
MRKSAWIIAIAATLIAGGTALAQDISTASDETRYLLDTALFVFAGLAAVLFVFGLGLRDVGLARTQHAPAVCLRTIGLVGVGAFSFWLVGYNLIHMVEAGGFLGAFEPWRPNDVDPMAVGRASGSVWFFQMGLAVIPAAIVSSAVSERVKTWPFILFAAAMAGLIYPIVAAWVWGGGYFAEVWRTADFGGAAVIHMTGGAAALAGALVIGPRPGRYHEDGPRPAASTALPLSAFAAGFILTAWIVILAGKLGSFSSIEPAISLGVISTNVVVAVAGAVLAALFLTQIVYHRAGLVTVINAVIAGLVSVSADPLHPALWQAAMVGAVGGVIVTVAPPFLDRFRIDDAGFVIPAHLLCGIWAMMIMPWYNPDASLPGQLIGAGAIAVFAFSLSALFWVALKYSLGVRLRSDEDVSGGIGDARISD